MVKSLLLMLNPLKNVDILFFILCLVIVALGVGIYFLIPVLNKKQYREQRENLKKREDAFRISKNSNQSKQAANTEPCAQETAPADENGTH